MARPIPFLTVEIRAVVHTRTGDSQPCDLISQHNRRIDYETLGTKLCRTQHTSPKKLGRPAQFEFSRQSTYSYPSLFSLFVTLSLSVVLMAPKLWLVPSCTLSAVVRYIAPLLIAAFYASTTPHSVATMNRIASPYHTTGKGPSSFDPPTSPPPR